MDADEKYLKWEYIDKVASFWFDESVIEQQMTNAE